MTRMLKLLTVGACAAALTACAGNMNDDAMMDDSMGASAGASADAGMASGSMSGGMAMANPTVGGAEMLATRNIVENAQNSPIHRTLVAAVVQAQLAETLSGPGPFTVFAPTDTAFNAVPAATRTSLMQDSNRAQLQSVLTYHVVPGRVTAADLARQIQAGGGSASLTTVQGGRLTARSTGGRVTITDAAGGTANVTTADVMQSNGVIHVVDRVLMSSR